ncbi:MAG: hypothetical protein SNJ71_07235 [Bacteroidales bacterium]
MKQIGLLLILFIGFTTQGFSQLMAWKKTRWAVYGGLGAANFMGELGGSNQIGSDFIRDFEISMTRPAFNAGIKYFLLERLSIQGAFSYGWLRGDDRKTKEQHRNNRNLQFRSPILEYSSRLQYNINYEKQGHRYDLRKVRGRWGNKVIFDIFAGISFFYFNPRGKDLRQGGTGKWYSLRPIGTEGQNFTKTRKPYSLLQISFPMGIVVNYIINSRWSINYEFGIRKTFTDYIDDVSKTYVNIDDVASNSKIKIDPELAKWFADPSISRQKGINNISAEYQQRGDSFNKDMYMFSFINLQYKLKTGRNGLPLLY